MVRYWKAFIQKGVPIPALKVYSDDNLTTMSDGIDRKRALEETGAKYALVWYSYRTNLDPPKSIQRPRVMCVLL